MEKPLSDYWQPNEARRFNLLFSLVSTLIEATDALMDPATLARVGSSKRTEQALRAMAQAIHTERTEWLALARERARGTGGNDGL